MDAALGARKPMGGPGGGLSRQEVGLSTQGLWERGRGRGAPG